jgi:hypothetical protein
MNEMTQANATAQTARGCRNGLLDACELTGPVCRKVVSDAQYMHDASSELGYGTVLSVAAATVAP